MTQNHLPPFFAIIQSIYKELNSPSSDKLKGVSKSRGIPFNSKEINRLTREDHRSGAEDGRFYYLRNPRNSVTPAVP